MSQVSLESTDLVFNSLGTIVQVRSEEPTLGELIGSLFRHFSPSGRRPDLVISITHDQDRYRVEKDEVLVADGCSRDKAVVKVLSIVNEASVYGATSLVVHAGAVARDGDVIAFPASANYTDNGGGDWFIDDDGGVFENAIDKLATAGVTLGCNPPANDRFCPNDSVTRGQMAAFLKRAFG